MEYGTACLNHLVTSWPQGGWEKRVNDTKSLKTQLNKESVLLYHVMLAVTWVGQEHRLFGLNWSYLTILGFIGNAIFSTRFLIQWIASEKKGKSVIPDSFWYWSIAGSVIMCIYWIMERSPVGILSYLPNSLIYMRNLDLIRKHSPAAPAQLQSRFHIKKAKVRYSPMSKDKIFKENMTMIADFNFGEKVAAVFDDMLDRSVPFYQETQRMIVEMAADFAVEGTNIYDLGCSTGTTLLNLSQNIPGKVKFIGIDYSQDMLAKCKQKLDAYHFSREHELTCADLNQGVNIENASVVVMLLTLQFIRPLNQDKLIGNILRGLNENGCLILVEKVLGEDSVFNRLFIKYYYDLRKRNRSSKITVNGSTASFLTFQG